MSMTREEAIKFAHHAYDMTDIPDVKEFYAIAENALREQEERRWIPVTERLPEPDTQVLAIVSGRWGNITFDRAYELASWSADEGWIMEAWPELENPEVTHWMPLPSAEGLE